LTQDVVELMDHLGVEKAHVAGSSAGGIVAINTAITYPDRVISVAPFASLPGLKMSAGYTRYDTWVDRIGTDGIAAFLRETIASRFDLSKVSPGFVDWFIAEAARNDVNLLGRFVGVMADADISDQLGKIRCPTLAVVPSGDPLHNMEQYEILKERIPDCEFIVYEGLPHNITDAVPDQCAIELSRFIARVSTSRPGAEG
jgi:pimeloyl-ACP methyl ester carboxylesterase